MRCKKKLTVSKIASIFEFEFLPPLYNNQLPPPRGLELLKVIHARGLSVNKFQSSKSTFKFQLVLF